LKAIIKPQYVDHLPKAVKGIVGDLLNQKNEGDRFESIIETLELKEVLDRDIANLSGGELQRFAIGVVCVQNADM